jgi:hypothetical protein
MTAAVLRIRPSLPLRSNLKDLLHYRKADARRPWIGEGAISLRLSGIAGLPRRMPTVQRWRIQAGGLGLDVDSSSETYVNLQPAIEIGTPPVFMRAKPRVQK